MTLVPNQEKPQENWRPMRLIPSKGLLRSSLPTGKNRRADFGKLGENHIQLRLPFFSKLTLQKSLLEVFTGLGGLAVVTTGAILAGNHSLDQAILPLLTILAMAAFLPVSEIAQVGRQLADTLGSTRRIYALEHEPVTIKDGPRKISSETASELSISNVGFHYPGDLRRFWKT